MGGVYRPLKPPFLVRMAHNQKQPKKLHKAHFHSLAGPPTDITNTHMHTHSVTPTFPHTRHPPPPHKCTQHNTHLPQRRPLGPWGSGLPRPQTRSGRTTGGWRSSPISASCQPLWARWSRALPPSLGVCLAKHDEAAAGARREEGVPAFGGGVPTSWRWSNRRGAPPRSRTSRNGKLFFFESFDGLTFAIAFRLLRLFLFILSVCCRCQNYC